MFIDVKEFVERLETVFKLLMDLDCDKRDFTLVKHGDIGKLALNTLKESNDEAPTKENIRLVYIKAEDKKYHECSKDEIEQFLTTL